MSGLSDEIGKLIGFVILCVAVAAIATVGGGALGAYLLAGALGAGKGLAIAAAVAGGVAGPVVAGGLWTAKDKWKKHKREKQWKSQRSTYTPPVVSAPTPQPAPAPVVQPAPAAPADDTPPVFVDALSKMKELPPDERRKYFDRLRDAFPNEVESLGGFNEQMALAHDAPTMKKLTFAKKSEPQA
jgi:hypothetical protein